MKKLENAKKRPTRCQTKFCLGIAMPNAHSPFCARCRMRRFKAAHPLQYSFGKLRARAKERGHEFSLTFEDYCEFAKTTGYDKLKGKTAQSLSINRKNPSLGYEKTNVEAVTLSMNSRLRYAPLPPHLRDEMLEAMKATA